MIYLANSPNVSKINPVIKDDKFINLEVFYKAPKGIDSKTVYKLSFRVHVVPSLLLLPSSLRKLSKRFKISNPKGIYPYKFINKDNLDYVGNVPSYSFFFSKKVSEALR